MTLVACAGLGCARAQSGAQSDDQEKAEQAAAKQRELEKNTLRLLEEVISGGWSLKLPENRSYVLASAADMLWPHDEKRARTLFWEALNSLNLPIYLQGNLPGAGTDSAKPARPNAPTKEQLEELNKYYAWMEKRREFLQKVARHDPQMALDMMRTTRPGPPPNVTGVARFDPDVGLEQELSFAAGANDPKRALQMARESLAKGLTYQVLNLLREVNQKDQDAGTQLAGDIIAKLETENFNSATSYAPFAAMSLLTSSRTTNGAVLTAGYEESSQPMARLKLDDQQKQDLVYLLTDAALSPTGSANVLQLVQFVMPEIEQYASDRLTKLKPRLAEHNRSLSPTQRAWNNLEAQFEKSTPEEMIRAASKVSEEMRSALFSLAAAKAIASGEADRYRELVNNLDDESQRRTALDMLNNEQMYDDLAHGKTDDLLKLVAQIRIKEQRAIAMAQLAVMLEKKDQHDAAVKLLDDARGLVKVDLANETQTNAFLAVMLGYALVEPSKAFAMIEPAIDHTNDQLSKLALVDKIAKTGAFKDGEIILNQPQMSLDEAIRQYSAGLVVLAKADFDRTKGLADRFQRNELKVAARLLIAQAMLRASAQAPKAN